MGLEKVEMVINGIVRIVSAISRALVVPVMLVAAFLVVPNPLAAQEKHDLVGSYRDWDAFKVVGETGERICYIISIPKDSTPKNVNRGKIYLTVSHKPHLRISDEVNIVVGYPFRPGSTASATISSTRHTFFTEGDGAWMPTPREDAAVVESMKRGNAMVVRGTSARGTNTRDRYSLMGFTAAYNAMTKSCE
jgi:hypothetical protein